MRTRRLRPAQCVSVKTQSYTAFPCDPAPHSYEGPPTTESRGSNGSRSPAAQQPKAGSSPRVHRQTGTHTWALHTEPPGHRKEGHPDTCARGGPRTRRPRGQEGGREPAWGSDTGAALSPWPGAGMRPGCVGQAGPGWPGGRAGGSGGPATGPWGDGSQQRAEGVRGGGGQGWGFGVGIPRGRRGCLCPGGFGEQVGTPGARGWTCRPRPLGGSCRPSQGQGAGAELLLRGAWEPLPGRSRGCPSPKPSHGVRWAEGRTNCGACGDVAPTACGGHGHRVRGQGAPGCHACPRGSGG